MSDLSWRVRQWIRKLLPITLIGALLYGSYSFYRQGIFRRGVGTAITSILHKIPYFGSRFKHDTIGTPHSYSYATGHRSYRRGRSYRHRNHHRRHAGRHQRHHRHHR